MKDEFIQPIQAWVLEEISATEEYLTAERLYKKLRLEHPVGRGLFKKALARLIEIGRLQYIYQHGCSFLVTSLNGPLHLTKRFIVKSPRTPFFEKGPIKAINIEQGASFGRGDHPSTILALTMIDMLFDTMGAEKYGPSNQALDIGTGSGILAIALALSGVEYVVGLDVDPCAIFEAKENVRLNKLENQVLVSSDQVENVQGSFGIVVANLRLPTLCLLISQMRRLVPAGGKIIFSGLKTEEVSSLLATYSPISFICEKTVNRQGWSAVQLTKV